MNKRRFFTILCFATVGFVCSVNPGAVKAVTQIDGAHVAVPVSPAPVCSGAMAYSVQETITSPGAIKAIGAAKGQANLAAHVYQVGTNTYLDYDSQIPFARLGKTVTLSTASNPIQVPENLIFVAIDQDGTIYVAYRVLAAICGSPSSGCLGMARIEAGVITVSSTSVIQRSNGVFGMTIAGGFIYVRTQGDGALGNDTRPVIVKVNKTTLTATSSLQLVAAGELGLDGAPYYDPVTNRLFASTGNGTGNIHIIDVASFSLTTTAALGVGAGANTRSAYDSVEGVIYVSESNGQTLRKLNGTTGAFIASVGGLSNLGNGMLFMDTPNKSLHWLGGNAGLGLQRYTSPGLGIANNLSTIGWEGIADINIGLNRIFEESIVPQLQVRSIKTCSTGA